MIGKLVITAIVLGSGAFLLLSDNAGLSYCYLTILKNMFLRMLARQPVILKIWKTIQQCKPNFIRHLT